MSNQPTIDLSRLNGTHIRLVMQINDSPPEQRIKLWLDLLDLAVEGGLEAIPLNRVMDYRAALDKAIGEAFNPKP